MAGPTDGTKGEVIAERISEGVLVSFEATSASVVSSSITHFNCSSSVRAFLDSSAGASSK
jgi:hypothetical protein